MEKNNKAIRNIKRFTKLGKAFGARYLLWHFLVEINDKLNRKPSLFIIRKLNNAIVHSLSSKYASFIHNFSTIQAEDTTPLRDSPYPVWVCWWQGAENMPELVKACYNSLCKNANGHPVNLVTKDNYADFVTIPDHLIEKLNTGIMTLTHFSNILRMTLLYEYGGMWVDATVLVTAPLPEICFNRELFSLKREPEGDNVSECRWTAFFFCGKKHNIFFKFIIDFLAEYWVKENSMPHYHLIDYTIATAYNSVPAIKEFIDKIPRSNPNLYYITRHLNEAFDPAIFGEICTDTCFHKLSWKKKAQEYTDKGKSTFYGYILSGGLEKQCI